MNKEISINELLDLLQEKHIKYNQEVFNYSDNGEEEFSIWLMSEISKRNKKLL